MYIRVTRRYSLVLLCLVIALYSPSAMAKDTGTLTAICEHFQGPIVRIQTGHEPAEKPVRPGQTKVAIHIDDESGQGRFTMWVDGDSEPIEGTILMEAPPGNKLRVFFGTLGGFIPVYIGMYRDPDTMIYSIFTSMPYDYKNPEADNTYLLQGDMLYGDCTYQ